MSISTVPRKLLPLQLFKPTLKSIRYQLKGMENFSKSFYGSVKESKRLERQEVRWFKDLLRCLPAGVEPCWVRWCWPGGRGHQREGMCCSWQFRTDNRCALTTGNIPLSQALLCRKWECLLNWSLVLPQYLLHLKSPAVRTYIPIASSRYYPDSCQSLLHRLYDEWESLSKVTLLPLCCTPETNTTLLINYTPI